MMDRENTLWWPMMIRSGMVASRGPMPSPGNQCAATIKVTALHPDCRAAWERRERRWGAQRVAWDNRDGVPWGACGIRNSRMAGITDGMS